VYRALVFSSTASLVLWATACGDRPSRGAAAAGDQGPSAAAAPAPASTPATGKVIEIKVISDERGNRFEPNEVHAKRGDVLRVTLASGVHNLSFPADKNPGAVGLPEPSPALQLPGQTQDIPITFGPGDYVFQCDPHAALGMTGKLDVDE
jgi:plastocyanin